VQEAITVTQALSHQAGLAGAISPVTPVRDLTNWDAMLARVAAAAPDSPPGSTCRYHIISFGFIMAGLVHAVSGRHIRDVVRADIALPLGIADEFVLGLPGDEEQYAGLEARVATLANAMGHEGHPPSDAEMERVAQIVQDVIAGGQSTAPVEPDVLGREPQAQTIEDTMPADPLMYNTRKVRQACIPSANGHFSARALARFFGALGNGGSIDGVRLVSDETLAAMAHREAIEQATPQAQEMMRRLGIRYACRPLPPPPTHTHTCACRMAAAVLTRTPCLAGACSNAGGERQWGLGFRIYGFKDGSKPVRYSGLGHTGLGGSVAFADLHTKTSVAVTVNALSLGKEAVNDVIKVVCQELGIGTPVEFD
jgi:aarF domain-containing kinase